MHPITQGYMLHKTSGEGLDALNESLDKGWEKARENVTKRDQQIEGYRNPAVDPGKFSMETIKQFLSKIPPEVVGALLLGGVGAGIGSTWGGKGAIIGAGAGTLTGAGTGHGYRKRYDIDVRNAITDLINNHKGNQEADMFNEALGWDKA